MFLHKSRNSITLKKSRNNRSILPLIKHTIMLKIPAGSSSGRKLRVPGKGATNLRTGKRGDQVVELKIAAPAEADADFMEALRKWSERQPYDPRAELGKGKR